MDGNRLLSVGLVSVVEICGFKKGGRSEGAGTQGGRDGRYRDSGGYILNEMKRVPVCKLRCHVASMQYVAHIG